MGQIENEVIRKVRAFLKRKEFRGNTDSLVDAKKIVPNEPREEIAKPTVSIPPDPALGSPAGTADLATPEKGIQAPMSDMVHEAEQADAQMRDGYAAFQEKFNIKASRADINNAINWVLGGYEAGIIRRRWSKNPQSIAEIAKELGIPQSTVQNIQTRAVKKIKARLEKQSSHPVT